MGDLPRRAGALELERRRIEGTEILFTKHATLNCR